MTRAGLWWGPVSFCNLTSGAVIHICTCNRMAGKHRQMHTWNWQDLNGLLGCAGSSGLALMLCCLVTLVSGI